MFIQVNRWSFDKSLSYELKNEAFEDRLKAAELHINAGTGNSDEGSNSLKWCVIVKVRRLGSSFSMEELPMKISFPEEVKISWSFIVSKRDQLTVQNYDVFGALNAWCDAK